MENKKMKRISKDEYYLRLALQIAERSTCLLRRYGAIVVKDDVLIASGYNGSPRGRPNCIDIGECPRENSPMGKDYENCRSVHAEMNAIINAARSGASVLHGVMYLNGVSVKEAKVLEKIIEPCTFCKRMIINAGIDRLVAPSLEIKVNDW